MNKDYALVRLLRSPLAVGLGVWLSFSSALARADTVLDWNEVALTTTAAAVFNPPLESRNLAIVHAAIFDAVNSIMGGFRPYAVEVSAARGASPDAAAASAAHFALVQLYPSRKSLLDAAYLSSLSLIPNGYAKTHGIEVGEAVATQILSIRATDGAEAAINAPYMSGSQPGEWIPTPPAFRPALDPGWGTVRTFLLREASQFRPGPPPALTSQQYVRDLNEIREIGSANSSTRTQDQTDLARFWVSTAPQIWNPAARQAAIARGFTLSQKCARVCAPEYGRSRRFHCVLGRQVRLQSVASSDCDSGSGHGRQCRHHCGPNLDAAARYTGLPRLHRWTYNIRGSGGGSTRVCVWHASESDHEAQQRCGARRNRDVYAV